MRTHRFWLSLLATPALASLPALAAAQPVGSEFQVNTYTTSDQVGSAVAGDEAGSFVVVWQSDDQDGSYWGIFGQRYDSAGSTLGSEFRVNSYTTSIQWDPAIASDATGWLTTDFVMAMVSTLVPPTRCRCGYALMA